MADGGWSWLTGAAQIMQRTLAPLWPNRLVGQVQPAAQGTETSRELATQNAAAAVAGLYPEPLATKPGETRDTIRVNAIRPIVQASVAFLFGTPPQWSLPDVEAAKEQAEQAAAETAPAAMQAPVSPDAPPQVPAPPKPKPPAPVDPRVEWMETCLAAMNWPGRLLDLGWNGATFGTAAWRIREPDGTHAYPYLQVLASDALRIQTNPRDIEDVTGYAYQLTATDPATGRPVVWRQRIERNDTLLEGTDVLSHTWTITDETAQFDGRTGWVDTAKWDEVAKEEWPFAWPPIVHCKNLPNPNVVYGGAEVTETLIETNLAINRSLTGTARIDRRHAGPRVWIKGMAGQVVDTRKELFEIPEEAEIGQLVPAVDASSSIAYRAELRESLCEESSTPSIVLGRPDKTGRDPSGIALRVKLWPLMHKTEMKRSLYEPMLTDTLQHLWELGGHGADNRVSWVWGEMLPTDPLEERNVAKADSDLGVASKETLAGKLGYDWDQEAVKIAAEKPPAPPMLSGQQFGAGNMDTPPGNMAAMMGQKGMQANAR